MTGLLPGTTYELTVVAVSQGGDINARSVENDAVIFGVIRQGMSTWLNKCEIVTVYYILQLATEQGFEVGALLGAISGILILIIILIFTVVIIIFWLRKRGKTKVHTLLATTNGLKSSYAYLKLVVALL